MPFDLQPTNQIIRAEADAPLNLSDIVDKGNEQILDLNTRYARLTPQERLQMIYQDFDSDKILVTSSFAATSAYFLHLVSRNKPDQVIHFIDTGYHFPETLFYRQKLIDLLGLTVVDVRGEISEHQFTMNDRTYMKDPDYCCAINKVNPLDAIKPQFHIWMSSLMSWQTDHRAELPIFELRRGIIKFNPVLEITEAERDDYIQQHRLPPHPLVTEGYRSIGCVHCTVKGEGRSGRWAGKAKTECGLHL